MRADEYGWPCRNFGNASATTAMFGRSAAMSSTCSLASIRTPTLRPSASSLWPSLWKRCSEMITSPRGMKSSSATAVNGSSIGSPRWPVHLMSVGIDGLLERGDAGAPEGVEEALAIATLAQVDVDHVLDGVGDLRRRQRRTQHLAQRGVRLGRAAQRHLVELLALLIDAEDADRAHVVVAAGVDAAADLHAQLADQFGLGRVGELQCDLLGDRDRPGVGQCAVVEPRAGDDVGDEAAVRRRQLARVERLPDRVQVIQLHVRQDQVLLVRDPDLVHRVALANVGDDVHLPVLAVAGRLAGLLQADVDDRIPGDLVRLDVVAAEPRERWVSLLRRLERSRSRRQALEVARREGGADAGQLLVRQVDLGLVGGFPLGLDLAREAFGAEAGDQHLDARLPDVVAPAVAV